MDENKKHSQNPDEKKRKPRPPRPGEEDLTPEERQRLRRERIERQKKRKEAQEARAAQDVSQKEKQIKEKESVEQSVKQEKEHTGGVLKWIIAAVIAALVVTGAYFIVSNKLFVNNGEVKIYRSAQQAIEAADRFVTTVNDLESAVKVLDANMSKDKDGEMKKKREEYFYWLSETKKAQAYQNIRNYDYLGAADILKSAVEINNGQDPQLESLYNTCLNFANCVEWTGDVEHMFFHSLIYDVPATFNGDYQTEDFDDYFVTVDEFRRILQRLYEENYVLYDLKKLYTVNEDGSVSRGGVFLPEGKKPLVMSFDDCAYYDYMDPYGFVNGMEVAQNGDVVTYITNDDGSKSYVEGDYVPILESFIKEHPDFSFGGAKGTIGLTGYEGVFGYRTNELEAADYPQRVEAARTVANRLKELGWNFASHSYGHQDYYDRDAKWWAVDTARWEAEVAPIIGGTDIFVYPHGTSPQDWNDARQTDLMAHGFKMYLGIYYRPQLDYYDNFVFMQRRNVDGIAFRYDRLNDMMNMDGIVDVQQRPQRDIAYH